MSPTDQRLSEEPLASVEHTAGRVLAACGHVCDARTLVYLHCRHGVTALCADCAAKVPEEPS